MIQIGVARGIAARVMKRQIRIPGDGIVEELEPDPLVFADIKDGRGIGGWRAKSAGQDGNCAVAKKNITRRTGDATGSAIGIGETQDVLFTKLDECIETVIGAVHYLANDTVGETDVR